MNATAKKATKLDGSNWYYRGFTITRNYISPTTRRAHCSTQRGYVMTPTACASYAMGGEWVSTLAKAVERVDWLYEKADGKEGSWLLVQSVVAKARKIDAERSAAKPVRLQDDPEVRAGLQRFGRMLGGFLG